jgi:hypothetical protein
MKAVDVMVRDVGHDQPRCRREGGDQEDERKALVALAEDVPGVIRVSDELNVTAGV